MGLIISVLVVCVGVCKVIQIYCVKGKKLGYKEDNYLTDHVSKNNTSSDYISKIRRNRDNCDYENVEIECTSQVLPNDSRSQFPRRYLVTEKSDESNARSPSPRKFIITADNINNTNLREFYIAKGRPKRDLEAERLVLIDTKSDFVGVRPLPLPKQFVITHAASSVSREKIVNIKQGIAVHMNSLLFEGREIKNLHALAKEVLDRVSLESEIVESKVLPTFSFSNTEELQATYNHTSEDSQKYPIFVPHIESKIDVILNTCNFNTTEYWSNKILVMPPKSSKLDIYNNNHFCIKDPKGGSRFDMCKQKSKSDMALENCVSRRDLSGDFRLRKSKEFGSSLDVGVQERNSLKKRRNKSFNDLDDKEKYEPEKENVKRETTENDRILRAHAHK